MGGGEAGHQFSQGSWNSGYTASDVPAAAYQGARGVQMWVYEMNRNRWHHMRGVTQLPPTSYTRLPIYDPVHDIVITAKGGQTWVYHYHTNNSYSYNNPASFAEYLYSNDVDSRRGLY